MKDILKLEEAAMFLGSLYLLMVLRVEWWWYLLLFIGPDISLLGYAGGRKTGAFVYNIFHHKGLAIAVFVIGWLIPDPFLQLTGILLFGHSSMDRLFGYGLKTKEGFKFTHLGIIGKK